MNSIYRYLGWLLVIVVGFAAPAVAKQGYGTLSGVVLDPSGHSADGRNCLADHGRCGWPDGLPTAFQLNTAGF